MSDSKKQPSEFEQAMQQLGVDKQASEPRSTATLRNERHQSLKRSTSPRSTQSIVNDDVTSAWPTLRYQDLEPETEMVANDLSAPLAAQSMRFHRGGLNQKTLKRLQRGQFTIQQRLDLHGMTVDESLTALNQCINYIEMNTNHCILIIHGKGYHSQGKTAKLKSLTERWCKAHPRVIAFCSATLKDGGTGAMYVLLRK